MHLSKNMKIFIWHNVKVGIKTVPTNIGKLCAGETFETLMSKSGIEQFYDLCPSYKEFHVNNSLPELWGKKRSQVRWGSYTDSRNLMSLSQAIRFCQLLRNPPTG